MRDSKTPATGPSLHYRRFAWAVLAIAVLVAIGASDFDTPTAEAAVAAEAPAAKTAAKPRAKLVRPASSWASADDGEGALAEQGETGGQVGTQADGQNPTMPGSDEMPAPRDTRQSPQADRPAPGEVGRLVAASRERSGGVDQGDEPVG